MFPQKQLRHSVTTHLNKKRSDNSILCRAFTGRCPAILLAASIGALITAHSQAAQAKKADAFVDTIGVNVHCPSDNIPVYSSGNAAGVTNALTSLGVRHIRIGAHQVQSDWDFFMSLYTGYGIKSNVLFTSVGAWTAKWNPGSTYETAAWFLQNYTAMIESIEGANETDCHPFTYKGSSTFPTPAKAWQIDLKGARDESSSTSGIPLLCPTVCSPPSLSYKLLGTVMDYETIHSYPISDHSPSSDMTSGIAYKNNADTTSSPTRPIVATETGYSTAVTSHGDNRYPVTELGQMKYYPRLFAEYFNLGIVRTYSYDLIDDYADPGNTVLEDHWGLVRNDMSWKPAFAAVRNLIGLLQEPNAPAYSPASLAYTLSGNTANVHQSLLQKSNGVYYLLLWQDLIVCSHSNTGTPTTSDIANADASVTVTLPSSVISAKTFRFDSAGALPGTTTPITNHAINVAVPDSMTIIELQIGTLFEAENLTVNDQTPAIPYRLGSDSRFSGGQGAYFDATAINQYLTYTLPNITAGTYDVRVGIKSWNNKGIWQLSASRVDGVGGSSNVGTPVDAYASGETFNEVDLGIWTPASTSDKAFKFTVTGKNGLSTSYGMAFDYIKLIPQ